MKQTWMSRFCLFTDGTQHKGRELDMITLRSHALQSYMTWLPMILSVHDMIIASEGISPRGEIPRHPSNSHIY